MSDLLESKTFLTTFANKNRKDKSIMKNLLFRIRRIMREEFETISTGNQSEQLGELIIRYFENSLVFIVNDIERPTLNLKFTPKQECTVSVLILVLLLTLLTQSPNEDRFYFLSDTFSKILMHIPLL